MTILVTGGAGYIGSHMVLGLLDPGEKVVVLDNLMTGHGWLVPQSASLVEGDVGDAALLDRVMSEHCFDTVAHFAGSIVVPESIRDPLGYYLNNTEKSRVLVAAAVRHQVPHFIFSSSAAVYGIATAGLIQETEPAAPISPYGRSKLMTEWMLEDAGRAHDLRYVALRYFNVAGADPGGRAGQSTPAATHLIKVALQAALGQRPHLEIFGRDYPTADGTCIRDYIHVSDLIGAHIGALDHLRKGGASGAFNCGYGRGHSVLEIVGAVERASGRKLVQRDAPRRQGDPAALVANPEQTKATFEWKPTHDSLDDIVSSALRWEENLIRRNAV